MAKKQVVQNAVKTAVKTGLPVPVSGTLVQVPNGGKTTIRVNLNGVIAAKQATLQAANLAKYRALSLQAALAELGAVARVVTAKTSQATATKIGNTGNGVCSQVHAWLNQNPHATKKAAQAALTHVNPITVGVQYGKWIKARKSA